MVTKSIKKTTFGKKKEHAKIMKKTIEQKYRKNIEKWGQNGAKIIPKTPQNQSKNVSRQRRRKNIEKSSKKGPKMEPKWTKRSMKHVIEKTHRKSSKKVPKMVPFGSLLGPFFDDFSMFFRRRFLDAFFY